MLPDAAHGRPASLHAGRAYFFCRPARRANRQAPANLLHSPGLHVTMLLTAPGRLSPGAKRRVFAYGKTTARRPACGLPALRPGRPGGDARPAGGCRPAARARPVCRHRDRRRPGPRYDPRRGRGHAGAPVRRGRRHASPDLSHTLCRPARLGRAVCQLAVPARADPRHGRADLLARYAGHARRLHALLGPRPGVCRQRDRKRQEPVHRRRLSGRPGEALDAR